jgi:hypothetical protein
MLTLTNAGRFFPVRPFVFSSARFSKTGSTIRHGGHVVDVKKAISTRWLFKSDAKDAELVQICIGALSVMLAGVPPKDEDVGV